MIQSMFPAAAGAKVATGTFTLSSALQGTTSGKKQTISGVGFKPHTVYVFDSTANSTGGYSQGSYDYWYKLAVGILTPDGVRMFKYSTSTAGGIVETTGSTYDDKIFSMVVTSDGFQIVLKKISYSANGYDFTSTPYIYTGEHTWVAIG